MLLDFVSATPPRCCVVHLHVHFLKDRISFSLRMEMLKRVIYPRSAQA